MQQVSILRRTRYKACPASDTIKRGEEILNKLGVKTMLFPTSNGELCHSYRMNIANENIMYLGLGSNGKGMTEAYAKASAMGEFIERFSSGIMFRQEGSLRLINPISFELIQKQFPLFADKIQKDGLLPPYVYAPDETVVRDKKQIADLYDKYIKAPQEYSQIAHHTFTEKEYEVTLPFWSYNDDTVHHLPYDMISFMCGSNGMCAGNTPQEAILQGIYELIERHVILKSTKEEIPLPNVSIQLFENTSIPYLIAQAEKKYNCLIRIKDCSLNEGWPALGVLFISQQKHAYHFHVGVDSHPETAVERCLTEALQGRNEIDFKPYDSDLLRNMQLNFNVKERQIKRIIIDGSGQFPYNCLFNTQTYDSISQFGFASLRFSENQDDIYDLNLICQHIQKKGFNIYIRDFSWTGFPVFQIYIPGMSEVSGWKILFAHNVIRNSAYINVHNPESYTGKASEHYEKLRMIITEVGDYICEFCAPIKNDFWSGIAPILLKAVLELRTNHLTSAKKSFQSLINKTTNPHHKTLYIYALHYCTLCEWKGISPFTFGLSNDAHAKALEDMYGGVFSKAAQHKLLRTPLNELFSNNKPCFNCDQCSKQLECALIPLLNLLKNVYMEYSKNIPSQITLNRFFINRHG